MSDLYMISRGRTVKRYMRCAPINGPVGQETGPDIIDPDVAEMDNDFLGGVYMDEVEPGKWDSGWVRDRGNYQYRYVAE